MISFVKGIAADLTENTAIVETPAGLGLEIYMTGSDLSKIRIGQELKIFTFFHVKEDGMQLFGFFSRDDLQIYRLLLGVNGVGPKGAIGILSGLTADELRFAVLSDDVKTICRAPGIGKKTAQKLILELKDKLTLEEAFEQKLANAGGVVASAESGEDLQDARSEAVEALVALGYTPSDALRAVKKSEGKDVESILRAALKNF